MKRFVRAAGLLVLILLAALVAAPFLLDANQFRGLLESRLSAALGRGVKLGDVKLAVFSGGLSAKDISVADDPAFSREPFVRAAALDVSVELLPLIRSRKLNVTGLTLERPQIVLLEDESGKWNVSSMSGRKSEPSAHPHLDLSVRLVKISGGRLTIGRTGRSRPQVLDRVDLKVTGFSTAAAFPFSFSARWNGGGVLELDGKAGPIDAADAALTPVQAKLKASKLDLAASGLVEPSSGIAGIAAVQANLASTGRKITLQGHLKAEKLKLSKRGTPAPRPVELDWAVDHDAQRRAGVLRRGEIRIGSAAAHLTGTYDVRPPVPAIRMKLAGKDMPVADLAAMLPALDIVLPAGSSLEGGTARIDFTAEGPADRLVSEGTLGLDNTRLKGFDMGGKITAAASLAGIKAGRDTDFKVAGARVRADTAGAAVDDINVVVPAVGMIAGAGTIAPDHTLDFKLQLTLHTSGGVMAALGQKGDTTIPLLISGTAANPVLKPDVSALAAKKIEELKQSKPAQEAKSFLKGLLGGKKEEKPEAKDAKQP